MANKDEDEEWVDIKSYEGYFEKESEAKEKYLKELNKIKK